MNHNLGQPQPGDKHICWEGPVADVVCSKISTVGAVVVVFKDNPENLLGKDMPQTSAPGGALGWG